MRAYGRPTLLRLVMESYLLFESEGFCAGLNLMPVKCSGTPFLRGGLFQKRLFRSVVFQVGIQKVQSIERNPGITLVGVLPFVVGYLISAKRCVLSRRWNMELNSLSAFLEVSPEGQLLLHAESEACSRANFLHVDFLEPDALKAGGCKRPEADA
jgi:hypothetical protein